MEVFDRIKKLISKEWCTQMTINHRKFPNCNAYHEQLGAIAMESTSVANMVSLSQVWLQTKQGYDYWKDICLREREW